VKAHVDPTDVLDEHTLDIPVGRGVEGGMHAICPAPKGINKAKENRMNMQQWFFIFSPNISISI
jgi:hypothetical protein